LKKSLLWRIALTTYLAGLALVGFWPVPVDKPIQNRLATVLNYLHEVGVPRWVNYQFVEASANVAMFIPLGVLVAMALPTRPWWLLFGIGLLASFFMELGQLLFIAARFASLTDIVTNALGGLIGICCVRLITAWTRTAKLADS